MLRFETKNALFGYFRLEFWKSIVIFKIVSRKFSKNECFTYTVNFGIGSAFFKCPGFAFSEGLGTGLGPLYKACCFKVLIIDLNFSSCDNKSLLEVQQC